MNRTVIIIPSRMSASRLKGKPLLEINNLPVICHVVEKAKASGVGDVIVATEDEEIFNVVRKNGGESILTGKHKTGTDRIFEAYKKLKKENIKYVLNLQGDEPMIDSKDILNLNNLMIENNSDIGTLACKINEDSILNNKNAVKVIVKEKLKNHSFTKALKFSRKILSKESFYIYHHIGIYAYKVSVLERFVNLNQTENEIENRLEQLRALDNNISISVALANSSPIGIDTKEDFVAIKKIMEYKS